MSTRQRLVCRAIFHVGSFFNGLYNYPIEASQCECEFQLDVQLLSIVQSAYNGSSSIGSDATNDEIMLAMMTHFVSDSQAQTYWRVERITISQDLGMESRDTCEAKSRAEYKA